MATITMASLIAVAGVILAPKVTLTLLGGAALLGATVAAVLMYEEED